MAEHELLVLPSKVIRNRPPCCKCVFGFGSAEVLGGVALVPLEDFQLDIARVFKQASLKKSAHCFWHASHVVVLPEEWDELAGEAVY